MPARLSSFYYSYFVGKKIIFKWTVRVFYINYSLLEYVKICILQVKHTVENYGFPFSARISEFDSYLETSVSLFSTKYILLKYYC